MEDAKLIKDHLKIVKENVEQRINPSVFLIKDMNGWLLEASRIPMPNFLFGEFWFEGELAILFADTNQGKSILAVQIGNSIASGAGTLERQFNAPKQTVLYFDCELSLKQFALRYSDENGNSYKFSDNFFRGELNPGSFTEDYVAEEQILTAIEMEVKSKSSRVIIIDNLSFLVYELEKSKNSIRFMRRLKSLKSKYKLSILCLAHTPKRDNSRPISKDDLVGSKTLMNFCDSAFAIGESAQVSKSKYIKQLKQRNTEQIYGADNVLVCAIIKRDNFLQFEFLKYGTEKQLLREVPLSRTQEIQQEARLLHEQEPELTTYKVAQRIAKDRESFKVVNTAVCKFFKNNGWNRGSNTHK